MDQEKAGKEPPVNDKRTTATGKPMPSREAIEALAGHRFRGGRYRVAHWENALLTRCTGAELLADAMVHPIALFHLPITGSGTSIAEMFALGQAESDLSIMIESYDWEFFHALREETDYRVRGQVNSAERCLDDAGNHYDRIQFCFEVFAAQELLSARSTITWHYTRNML
mgnify:CR=1 FL=1|jgi:hypothetical protein